MNEDRGILYTKLNVLGSFPYKHAHTHTEHDANTFTHMVWTEAIPLALWHSFHLMTIYFERWKTATFEPPAYYSYIRSIHNRTHNTTQYSHHGSKSTKQRTNEKKHTAKNWFVCLFWLVWTVCELWEKQKTIPGQARANNFFVVVGFVPTNSNGQNYYSWDYYCSYGFCRLRETCNAMDPPCPSND